MTTFAALMLFDETKNKYYLYLVDRWLETASIDGPWSAACLAKSMHAAQRTRMRAQILRADSALACAL